MTSDTEHKPISRSAATKIGSIIKHNGIACFGKPEYTSALRDAQTWRAQHVRPTQQCFAKILECSQQYTDSVAIYRLKRMISIINKLQQPDKHYKLGELDDIGGCRLIVNSIEDVREAVTYLSQVTTLKKGNSKKDYIAEPPASGYRSVHLLTKFEDKGRPYRVEVQVRTRLQHYWATAVEAASEIYGRNYKSPNSKALNQPIDRERLEFFALVSSLFAYEEGTKPVMNLTGGPEECKQKLRNLSCTSATVNDLKNASGGVYSVGPPPREDCELFLLKFYRDEQYLSIDSFADTQLEKALSSYDELEHDMEQAALHSSTNVTNSNLPDNIVLVHGKGRQLSIAYPNYSANVNEFIQKVEKYLG